MLGDKQKLGARRQKIALLSKKAEKQTLTSEQSINSQRAAAKGLENHQGFAFIFCFEL